MSLSVDALCDMFPDLPVEVIAACLEACGDEAIAALLEMCSDTGSTGASGAWGRQDDPPSSPPPGVVGGGVPAAQQQRRGGHSGSKGNPNRNTSAGQHRPAGQRKTWGQLRTAEGQPWAPADTSTTPQLRPTYVESGAASHTALASAVFPDLFLASTPAAPSSSSARAQPPAPHRPHRLSDGLTYPGYGRGRGGGSSSHAAADGGSWPYPRPHSFTSAPDAALLHPAGRGAGGGRAPQARPQPQPLPGRATGGRYLQVARDGLQLYAPSERQPAAMRAVSSWPSFVGEEGHGVWAGAGAVAAAGAGNVARSGGPGGSSSWQECAVEELCRTHGWAGRELIEAVCLALQYDMAEVVAALDELRAATFQARASASSSDSGSSASASSSAASSNAASREASEDESDARHGGGRPRRRRDGSGAAAAAALGTARGSGPAAAAVVGGARGLAAPESGGGGGGRRSGRRGETSLGGDAYMRHRHEALKLTHSWRKKMDKASAAFSSGQRALGQQLVAEAQEVRRAAAAKHLEAASRIEAELNAGRQLSEWELDLHGLHADEAVEVGGGLHVASRGGGWGTLWAGGPLPRWRVSGSWDFETLFTSPAPCSPDMTYIALLRTNKKASDVCECYRHSSMTPCMSLSAYGNQEVTTSGPFQWIPSLASVLLRHAQALARRLAALQVAPSEPRPLQRTQGGPHKQAFAAAEPASAAPTASPSRQPGSGVSCAGTGGGAGEAARASRRVLQVIVGRGLHSARGEASLPRVVESYLLGRGLRFTPRAGQIEVQLPRSFAGPAAAAAAQRRQP
ncbi:hypothetical protein TSOC_000563 [Tetrabaena socialis]|uniref:CUE domain-containing protein n=1 Tax=Tetrabaena socialis TaxID=47790 RepID=A0A2J8AJ20_9CHLO|nr:hypothetical protein TSOC_000563 [Tetrabaena socialis]|eukprot:PNH12508.1 hypothetical protein TSOC_000563 [Tetrabaena socialis]